jgi:outer membrane receptor protein involved in Fe transport
VPANRGSVRAVYSNPKYLTAAIGVQFVGLAVTTIRTCVPFRRSRSTTRTIRCPRPPDSPARVDFTVSRAFGRNMDVFFGMQNVFNRVYFVGDGADHDRRRRRTLACASGSWGSKGRRRLPYLPRRLRAGSAGDESRWRPRPFLFA